MSSTAKYTLKDGKTVRWRAMYRDPSSKSIMKSGFRTKREAEAFLSTVEVSKLAGGYIAPADGRSTVGQLGKQWLEAHEQTVKPSTYHSDESAWRIHVEPHWGARTVGDIRHTEIQAWVAKLASNRSATTVARAYGVLSRVLENAVKDRKIASNPASDVKLPRKTSKERGYLTHSRVEALAKESRFPDLVLFLAYTGLRWGEATGLRVKHVDLKERRLVIQENAVWVNGHVKVGTPKTHEQRTVVYPKFLSKALKTATAGKKPNDLIWGHGEEHLQQPNSRRGWFAGAVERCQSTDENFPYITPHDLRHTAASLAISAGANAKVVQRMLGHASAAMTLDRYADLFPDDLDQVADALDLARRNLTKT